jgi:four helix bundle protein
MNMEMFRFDKLGVWKKSIELFDRLFDIAVRTNMKYCYRFSQQLRAAAMSITNNIAEGSASTSDKDFAQFLNIARRSVFECVNILILFERRKYITLEELDSLKFELSSISKMLTNLRKSLLNPKPSALRPPLQ